MSFIRIALAVCLGAVPMYRLDAQAVGPESGPLVHEFPLTLTIGSRVEAVGPFLSFERRGSVRQSALSPLLSHTVDMAVDSEEWDFAYPIVTYDRYGKEYRFQIYQLLSFAGGQNQKGNVQSRFTLFPFYFQQRSSDPKLNYTALFPIYGRLENHLFRDEIRFCMFPIYGQSRKKDVVTDNYLYPLFHLRHGDGLKGWQFWPLVGREHKEVTTLTNGFGDRQLSAGRDETFVLWPFYFNSRTAIGTTNPQTHRVLLPFYSLQRSPNRDSSTYLWPFLTYTDDREKHYREWGAPWPFIVLARGEGKTVNRLWPLFSQARNPTLESDFYLWPLYKFNRVHAPPLDRKRTRILFFLYSDLIEKNEQTGTEMERTDLWPLFTARRDHDGNQRLQLLAPLETFVPNNKSIERNYAPLWSIWRSERNAKTGASSQSFLWNLYRRDTAPAARKFSLLFGLIQYQSAAAAKRLRLFYVPVWKSNETRADRAEP
jgi:hypothetical protein